MYQHYIKRILDILLALVGIIVADIPMGFIALAIKLDSKGPVVFKQERIGRNRKVYTIMKISSMKTAGYIEQETGLLTPVFCE